MDGNGRWAKARGLPRTAGHERGEAALFDVVEGAIELGVGWLSAYAFSTENWKRSPDEVRFLMGFNRDVIRRRRDEMHALGVRVRWAGRRPKLWRSVIAELEEAEERVRRLDTESAALHARIEELQALLVDATEDAGAVDARLRQARSTRQAATASAAQAQRAVERAQADCDALSDD